MTASEYALHDAAESDLPRESRIASTVLGDRHKYQEWETRHANLLLPVAEQRSPRHQILELRRADLQLVHRRALFRYLQTHEVPEARRQQLFRLFHASLDYYEAILTEHRQYMLAFSSGISTHHIIDVMQDNLSTHLVNQYESLFSRYFEMKCFLASSGNTETVKLVRASLRDAQGQLLRVKRRLETELPRRSRQNFERRELLARTGRHKVRNYLNAYEPL